MNETVLKQYIETHFAERPTEELNWKYQVRDMLDETICELAGIGIFSLIWLAGKQFPNWGVILFPIACTGLVICGICAIYLLSIVFLRRICMRFKLTPDHFVFSHGLFSQKTETFQLSDIIEVDIQRSIWERIIHTGTIKIRFKNGMDSPTNPLVIRGIGKYDEMFQKIDYYRNHHRLVLYFGI